MKDKQQPKICNLCGGDVEYISNALIYGRQYGSGYAYRCKKCGAFVGTHENNPRCALGILADSEMIELRKKCHSKFDTTWKNAKERRQRYAELADKLGIEPRACHFSWFDKDMLNKALEILG